MLNKLQRVWRNPQKIIRNKKYKIKLEFYNYLIRATERITRNWKAISWVYLEEGQALNSPYKISSGDYKGGFSL